MCEFMATPLHMCPSRESAVGGRETPGRLFFGSFLWSEQRNEHEVSFCFKVIGGRAAQVHPTSFRVRRFFAFDF